MYIANAELNCFATFCLNNLAATVRPAVDEQRANNAGKTADAEHVALMFQHSFSSYSCCVAFLPTAEGALECFTG
jgi:hypothetical protein